MTILSTGTHCKYPNDSMKCRHNQFKLPRKKYAIFVYITNTLRHWIVLYTIIIEIVTLFDQKLPISFEDMPTLLHISFKTFWVG